MPNDSTPLRVPADLLGIRLRATPDTPAFTYYDEGTGERTELSAVTLDNWLAKTANLLVDGGGLDADGRAAVLLPPHWQTAAVLLGCFAVGLSVSTRDDGTAPADVAFATPDALDAARRFRPADTYLLGLAPLAQPIRELPPGTVDYVVEVRAFGDRFVPVTPVEADAPALAGATHGELVGRAQSRAAELGLGGSDRLLLATDPNIGPTPEPVADRAPDLLDWLLAPLAAGASIVLCHRAGADRLAAIAAAERATATLGVDVPGLRRAG